MNFKKPIAVILAVLLLCSFIGCGKSKKTGDTVPKADTFTLPFSRDDALDPYAAASECNRYLCPLIYESLYTITEKHSVKKQLAVNEIIEEKMITVTLGEALFSDGEALTSDDVVYSFNRAKQSENYQNELENILSAERKGSGVVRFTLKNNDIFALNLLTFPIISQKDNRIGSGIYYFEENAGEYALEYNKNHAGNKPQITRIALCECADYSKAGKLFTEEKIDYLFEDLADGNTRTAAVNTQKGKLGNLLFIGINAKKGVLKNKQFRHALSLAIDQTALCEQALEGFASPTATLFESEWEEIGSIVATAPTANSAEAKKAFKKAACAYDKMGVTLMYDEKPVALEILVNSANNMKIALAQQIKTQLVNFGINAEVKTTPLDEYNIAVENGNFELYIGEVKIANDYNFDCFFSPAGGADFGIETSALQSSYRRYREGGVSLQDFISVFCEENPFIPIGYKYANVCLDQNLQTQGIITQNNLYPQIEEWSQ